MQKKRVISFLPSATELIYELGAQEKLFGVTHECNYPSDARNKPKVIESVFEPENMSSLEIDKKICDLSEKGEDIYKLVTQNVSNAKPDLIISQEICEVCSAYTNQVKNAIEILDEKPEIYSMSPHDIQGILKCVDDIAEKIDEVKRGNEIVNSLNSRIEEIKNVKISSRPKVLGIEWLNPFFTSGHWVPEMIEISGGVNMITKTGEHSSKMEIDEIEKEIKNRLSKKMNLIHFEIKDFTGRHLNHELQCNFSLRASQLLCRLGFVLHKVHLHNLYLLIPVQVGHFLRLL